MKEIAIKVIATKESKKKKKKYKPDFIVYWCLHVKKACQWLLKENHFGGDEQLIFNTSKSMLLEMLC